MSLSRRSFVQTLGVGATGLWIAARAAARRRSSARRSLLRRGRRPSIILSSNENPLGCHKDVLAAVKRRLRRRRPLSVRHREK